MFVEAQSGSRIRPTVEVEIRLDYGAFRGFMISEGDSKPCLTLSRCST